MALPLVCPLGFLVAAIVDDLCFKKFHNWLFLTLCTLGFLFVFLFDFTDPLQAFGGFLTGGALMLPLVLIGAIGAGDMKFMMSFGILMGSVLIFEIFIYSLFWGALIGLFRSFFSGHFPLVVQNLMGFFYKVKPVKTQKIPYTVAIFLGWLTESFHGGLF